MGIGRIDVGRALPSCSAQPWHSPPPGTAVQGQPLARVTLQDRVDVNLTGPFDTFIQKVTIAPGGETGWHSHPIPVLTSSP